MFNNPKYAGIFNKKEMESNIPAVVKKINKIIEIVKTSPAEDFEWCYYPLVKIPNSNAVIDMKYDSGEVSIYFAIADYIDIKEWELFSSIKEISKEDVHSRAIEITAIAYTFELIPDLLLSLDKFIIDVL